MLNVVRVAVVDDHPIFREGVSSILSRSKRHAIVAVGEIANDAVRIAKEILPDILLLDVSLPGGGLAAVREVSELCPAVKIIMLASAGREDDASNGLSMGARGYILKCVSARELLNTIDVIYSGATYVSPQLAAQLLVNMRQHKILTAPNNHNISALTLREEQILEQVTLGLTNKEVAKLLEISEKTVKHYMTNIMQKLHVRNRVEAANAGRARHHAG